ncbi:MAG: LamG domain-containing protein [Victivallaceae bacterium]|nr:LamG domain-containing protein [Victivallaceae bacterium]
MKKYRLLKKVSFAGVVLVVLTGLGFSSSSQAANKDLLFETTFDKMIVRADYAKGSPEALKFKGTLEFRMNPGYNNKCSYLRQPGEKLEYNAVGNFNPKAGTISFWFKALNWKPGGDGATTLSKFKHLLSARIKTTTGKAVFTFYKYYQGANLSFLISPSLNKKNFICGFDASILKQDQWYKVDCTWGDGKMTVFIDGKKVTSTNYGEGYKQVANGKLLSGKILINPILWGGKHENEAAKTLIDDVKIYRRALSAAEIKRDYLKDKGEKIAEAELASITMAGVDRNNGRLDQINAAFDLNGLPDSWQQAIKGGKVKAQLKLSLDGKILLKKTYLLKKLKFNFLVARADKKGTVTAILDLTNQKSGKKLALKQSITRPDTSWFGNQYGKDDFVPQPWTAIEANGDSVTLWNRTYQFDGPFIKQVTSGGKKLLSQPTKLLIDVGNGRQTAVFTPGKIVGNRKDRIVFTGLGSVGDLVINYRNTVWFDGFSRIEFSLGPQGAKVKSMQLTYTVKPEFAKYMANPIPEKFKAGGNYFDWKGSSHHDFSQLWLMGRVNGLCWVAEDEGNWVYPQNSKPIKVIKNSDGAKVTLDIISKPVMLPTGVKYAFGFIATPTRPLPENYRTIFFAGWKTKNINTASTGWGGRGFTQYASLIPSKTYEKNMSYLKRKCPNAKSYPYSSPTGLSDAEPVVKYFLHDWTVPGGSVFPTKHAEDKTIVYNQVPLIPTQAFRDFFADKVENFLSKKDKYTGGVYYDLVHPWHNSSSVAYGKFTDAFGRKIPSQITIIGLRECLMRTIKICRKYGMNAIYHGHIMYNPAAMGLADFWYPGEHLNAKLAKNKFYYTDEMSQDDYDVNYSSEKKGVGIINLPVIGRTHKKYRGKAGEAATKAMLGRMTLNDIVSSATQCYQPTVDKMWGIKKKYKLDNAEFIKFDINKLYSSDNKNIVASFYLYPDKQIFAVVYNQTQQPQSATLTIPGYKNAYDAWNDRQLKIVGNKLEVNIPGRGFMLVILKN